MFYEFKNSLVADDFKIESGVDFSFPAHLHGSFEFITVTEGEMTVTVDGTTYQLTEGKSLLIFPNQTHELSTIEHSRHLLCIFSPKLVSAYNKVFLTNIPQSNAFNHGWSYAQRIASLKDGGSILIIKGILYSLCGDFDSTASYKTRDKENDELLFKIFRFVESNYSKDCSLYELSSQTSYNYVYLSKFFKERTGSSFTDYVCRYRISEACHLLQNSDQTILKTAFECGFESLRSFNRNFKKIVGKTPSEYKAVIIKK